MELRKSPFLIAILLEIMILTSTILLSHNNTSAQTYESITKQREEFKNNPQIPIGRGYLGNSPYNSIGIGVNPTTNKIYVANPNSNTVSVINSNTGNVTNNIRVGITPNTIAVNELTNKIYVVNSASNTVSVIDGNSDKKEPNDIPVGKNPVSIISSRDKIYVVNSASNTVSYLMHLMIKR